MTDQKDVHDSLTLAIERRANGDSVIGDLTPGSDPDPSLLTVQTVLDREPDFSGTDADRDTPMVTLTTIGSPLRTSSDPSIKERLFDDETGIPIGTVFGETWEADIEITAWSTNYDEGDSEDIIEAVMDLLHGYDAAYTAGQNFLPDPSEDAEPDDVLEDIERVRVQSAPEPNHDYTTSPSLFKWALVTRIAYTERINSVTIEGPITPIRNVRVPGVDDFVVEPAESERGRPGSLTGLPDGYVSNEEPTPLDD